VFHFGRILGRALEAQLIIAIVNTALTAVGLAFMGIPNIAFLSAVVFVCSFIPVAGVFLSSVPICLAALTKSGLSMMLWSIVFVTIIHMIEAYILNPRIYGARLRMNPVLVLAILVISNHLFGVWGLILGVPVVNYLVHVIRSKGSKIEWESAA
jgi:predicted PurR-regulated permease PerM